MSEQFREHLSDRINHAIELTLNEYEGQTYSEIIGVLDTIKMEYFFEYLEAKKHGTAGDEGETPETGDGSAHRSENGERSVPPSEPDSDAATSSET